MPQTRQARPSGENLNYMTLAPQARQARPSGENLNYLLSRYSDILSMIIELLAFLLANCLKYSDFCCVIVLLRHSNKVYKDCLLVTGW